MLETVGVGEELLLYIGARTNLIHDSTVLKDEHGRNPADTESRSKGFVLIDVDLGDLGLWPDV